MCSDGLFVVAYASQKQRGYLVKKKIPNHLLTSLILEQIKADIKMDKKTSEGIPFKEDDNPLFLQISMFFSKARSLWWVDLG